MNAAGMLDRLTSSKVILIGILPTCAAGLFLAFLVGAGAPGPLDFAAAWRATTYSRVGQAIPAIIGVLLLSIVIHPLQPLIVWLVSIRWFSRKNWRAILTYLIIDRAKRDRRPTLRMSRLGRLTYHRTAGGWYGFAIDRAWPRLYPVLSAETRAMVDDRRDQLDLSARVTFTAAATTVAVFLLLLRSGWVPCLLLSAIPAALAVVSYQAAVLVAAGYHEACRVAFDLHRFDLLTAMHIELPQTPAEEIALNHNLSQFWEAPQNGGLPASYKHPT
ncbi:hypothetical protein [Nocardia altamirensis]|uniref:hypothetical protein n=1 Tax=Nocardia altamirensis TaxID=472158 RepID=UPI00084085AB|nr:hypothetical protein [Nocardia altamirensis]